MMEENLTGEMSRKTIDRKRQTIEIINKQEGIT